MNVAEPWVKADVESRVLLFKQEHIFIHCVNIYALGQNKPVRENRRKEGRCACLFKAYPLTRKGLGKPGGGNKAACLSRISRCKLRSRIYPQSRHLFPVNLRADFQTSPRYLHMSESGVVFGGYLIHPRSKISAVFGKFRICGYAVKELGYAREFQRRAEIAGENIPLEYCLPDVLIGYHTSFKKAVHHIFVKLGKLLIQRSFILSWGKIHNPMGQLRL